MTTRLPVVIVGGGISGLVCACTLRKAGIQVRLLEATERCGGAIHTERREGFLLEFGPQSFTGSPSLRTLITALRLEDQIVTAPGKAPRYVLVNGRLKQVPLSPPAFLFSSLFSVATKGSVLRDIFASSHPPKEDESIAHFVRRKFTPELLDRLVGPFVSGIYAGDPERLSLRAAFPQLHAAEKEAQSVIRGLRLASKRHPNHSSRRDSLSFRDGNEALIRGLLESIGDSLQTASEVVALQRSDDGQFQVTVRSHGRHESLAASQIVLACPAFAAARLVEGFTPALATTLREIQYAPIAVVSLGYKSSEVGANLNGFGFLVPRSAQIHTLGTVWNSSLFPARAPQGHALLTSFIGGMLDAETASLPENDLVMLAHREMASILAVRQAPVLSHVQKYEHAIPQYDMGHAARVDAIEALRLHCPGFWLVGNYLRGPAIGACVEQATAVAKEIQNRVPS